MFVSVIVFVVKSTFVERTNKLVDSGFYASNREACLVKCATDGNRSP